MPAFTTVLGKHILTNPVSASYKITPKLHQSADGTGLPIPHNSNRRKLTHAQQNQPHTWCHI